jgi:uncharacterized membrane protein
VLRGALWNLWLAVIPVVLGFGLVGLLEVLKARRLPAALAIPVALAWLVFLPNTCYLLTEWRHLLFDPAWADLLDEGRHDRRAMLHTARWALVFMLYSGSGLFLMALAIRPVERWLRTTRVNPMLAAPFFFLLVSLGVYLGLILRFNSWDLLRHPGAIWAASLEALTTPILAATIVVFGAILWGLYEALDLWMDGVEMRLRRWLPGDAAPAPRAADPGLS